MIALGLHHPRRVIILMLLEVVQAVHVQGCSCHAHCTLDSSSTAESSLILNLLREISSARLSAIVMRLIGSDLLCGFFDSVNL
jgi:hypothetical protein